MLKKFLLGLLLFGISVNAYAVSVTDTYRSIVSSKQTDIFSDIAVGDEFIWSVSYDNEGTRQTFYDNTNNISTTVCLDTDVESGCSIYAPPGIADFLSDAIFDISSILSAIDYSIWTPYQGEDNLQSTVNQIDFFHAQLTEGTYEFWLSEENGDVGFRRYYDPDPSDSWYEYEQIHMSYELLSRETNQIPVPAPLALMGFGLLAIGFTRKRKSA